jgi:hypothetical protein
MPATGLPADVTLCIGIGAQRSGTSWLGTYFKRHPSIYMSPIKELHYFDSRWTPELTGRYDEQFLARLQKLLKKMQLEQVREGPKWEFAFHLARRVEMIRGGHKRYLEFFGADVGDRPVAAEITPSYSVLEADHFREIHGLHPRVKLVYLMRNPVDRAWSLLRHRTRRPGFDMAQRLEKTMTGDRAAKRSDYIHTLTALDAAVPAEDVFIEFYETLFTRETMERLCGFLGIPYHPAPFDKVVGGAVEKPMATEQRAQLRTLLRPVYDHAAERFGDRLPEAWRADMG